MPNEEQTELVDNTSEMAVTLNESIRQALLCLAEVAGVEEAGSLLVDLAIEGGLPRAALSSEAVKGQLQQQLGRAPTKQEVQAAQRAAVSEHLANELGRAPTEDEVLALSGEQAGLPPQAGGRGLKDRLKETEEQLRARDEEVASLTAQLEALKKKAASELAVLQATHTASIEQSRAAVSAKQAELVSMTGRFNEAEKELFQVHAHPRAAPPDAPRLRRSLPSHTKHSATTTVGPPPPPSA